MSAQLFAFLVATTLLDPEQTPQRAERERAPQPADPPERPRVPATEPGAAE